MFFIFAQFVCGILLTGLFIGFAFTNSVRYDPSVPKWAQVIDRINLGLSIGWSLLGKFAFVFRSWIKHTLHIQVDSRAWDASLRTMNRDVMPGDSMIMKTLSSPVMHRLLERIAQNHDQSQFSSTKTKTGAKPSFVNAQITERTNDQDDSQDCAPWDSNQDQDQKETEMDIKDVLRTQLPKKTM